MALTGEEVVSAISSNIRSKFTTSDIVKIYKNKPQQGMEKPCAFIHQINADQASGLGPRAERNYLIDIRVHPKDGSTEVETWARSIAEQVMSCVNKITISGQVVKARSSSWRTEEGVLHVIMGYAFRVVETTEDVAPKMVSLKESIIIRKGEE